MKRKIRLSESDLHRIIKESVKKVLKEGKVVDYKERIMSLINDANNAYNNAVESQDGSDMPLMDKKGNFYGLSGQITLDRNGYVTIPFQGMQFGDYEYPEKIRVLKKVNGKVCLIKGDYNEEGWRDVQRMLKNIIRDAQIGNGYFTNYDPAWEDSETREDYEMNRSNLRDMNKKIGRNALRKK